MVEKLARRLKDTPDDIEGWTMMARSYAALGRFKEAADAYAHLTKLLPQDADMLADYADALAMANNRTMQGEPEKAILRALQLDPKNIKALALSAVADSERHDYTGAVAQWRKIMALAPPDSDLARSVGSNINEALALAGTPAANGATGTSGASDTAKANARRLRPLVRKCRVASNSTPPCGRRSAIRIRYLSLRGPSTARASRWRCCANKSRICRPHSRWTIAWP